MLGVDKRREDLPPPPPRPQLSADEEKYMDAVKAGLERALERFSVAHNARDVAGGWSAAGGAVLGLKQAAETLQLRREQQARDHRTGTGRAARQQRRHDEHDEDVGKAPARKRRDNRRRGSGRAGIGKGRGRAERDSYRGGNNRGVSKPERRGGGGGGGSGSGIGAGARG